MRNLIFRGCTLEKRGELVRGIMKSMKLAAVLLLFVASCRVIQSEELFPKRKSTDNSIELHVYNVW